MASSETPGAVDDRSERFLSRKVLDARSSQGASKVWAEVTALARLPGVLDLGQGWPDFGANDVARNAASDALVRSPDPRANQYSPVECARKRGNGRDAKCLPREGFRRATPDRSFVASRELRTRRRFFNLTRAGKNNLVVTPRRTHGVLGNARCG